MSQKNGQLIGKAYKDEFSQGKDPVFPEPENVFRQENDPTKIVSEEKLFVPMGNDDLRHLYPELNDYKQFKDLTSKEMNFVWYVGCKSSPYYDLSLSLRISQCADLVWGVSDVDSAKKYGTIKEMPEYIAQAIKRMEIFSPTARSRARKMAFNIMKNYERMAELSVDAMFHVGKFDWAAAKEFTETMGKISRDLNNVVFILENGYGMSRQKDLESETDQDLDMSLVEKWSGR